MWDHGSQGNEQKLTMDKVAIVSGLSKYIHLSMWIRNQHVNIAKGHRLERVTVLQRELKKIRGRDAIAMIVVTAPGTVDDVDTTELYTLENHF